MNNLSHSERVDALIQHFWKSGYLTLRRKFGTYLPEPETMGKYEIDALGKFKKSNYAIGITLTGEDLNNKDIINKLEYLATRHTKYTNKNVKLFVAVPRDAIISAKIILLNLTEEARKNIKLAPISTETVN
ncbi:MAG: hypothetical protein JEY94_16130 [Melioribacteraceae bacterium]|nr:hypothetical protein [Melioribacteraceae bacterium]